MGEVFGGSIGALFLVLDALAAGAFCIVFHAAEAGDTPAPPKAGEIAPPAAVDWRDDFQMQLRG